MLVGQVVDWQVALSLLALREDRALPQDLAEQGRTTFLNMLRISKAQADQMRAGRRVPAGSQTLMADYYDDPVPDPIVERSLGKVEQALDGFAVSEVLTRIKTISPKRWSPHKEPFEFGAIDFMLDGNKVLANIDFWAEWPGKGLAVFDWKAGRFPWEDEGLQMSVYSLWGQVMKGYDREQVLVQAVHLPESPGWEARPASEVECDSARAVVRFEHESERERVREMADRKGVVRWNADREQFQPTPGLLICSKCKFREVCPEGRAILGMTENA